MVEREKIWEEQRKTRGFDDTELWNLDITFCDFMIPRLKAYIELEHGNPPDISHDDWLKILNRIVEGFELYKTKFSWEKNNYKENKEIVKEALSLFSKFLWDMWL